MKKIALMLPAMRMGGAEKVGLEFLKDLKQYYDVTLILNKKEGALLDLVPSDVKIIEDKILSFSTIVKSDLKKFKIFNLVKDFLYYLKIKLKRNSEKNYSYCIKRVPKLKEQFDVVICYVANVSTQIFSAVDRIDASQKIAWIHGETTELKDTKLFEKYYNRFDKIYCVSKVSREHFINRFKSLASKTDVYYNRINKEDILEKANSDDFTNYENENNIVITTVARLTHEKGCLMIPDIAQMLIQKGYNICWLVVGNGTEFTQIQEKINLFNLQKNVILLGEKVNPYPYIKQADIYVQPSYEEGYSTTICEAGILGKVIVGTTTSGGIREQIEDKKSGLIVEPTIDGLTKGIETIINDKELKLVIEKEVVLIDFSNKDEIKKIREYIG